MKGLSDYRYASLVLTAHIHRPVIFATTRVMRTNTKQTVCAPKTSQSFMISKCPPETYLALYFSSLSSSDFMGRTYLAVTRLAQSHNSALRTAREVHKINQISDIRIHGVYHFWVSFL